jgi:predicted transcriptional regulator
MRWTSKTRKSRLLAFRVMPNKTVKERAIEAIRSLRDNATLEDAIERLCFIAKVEEGLRQSEAGELIPHEEVKKQLLS